MRIQVEFISELPDYAKPERIMEWLRAELGEVALPGTLYWKPLENYTLQPVKGETEK